MYYTFTCPTCGAEVEADITIVYGGHAPSYFEPGEGAEWELVIDCLCAMDADDPETGCGRAFTDAEISAAHEDAIQQAIGEHLAGDYDE